MEQNKINKQNIELPDTLYQLIGEFVLSFNNLIGYKQVEAKEKLVKHIVCFYSEYKDILVEYYDLPHFKTNEFEQCYTNMESKLRNRAEEAIKKYNLEEYRDIIMENYALTVPALINIAEYCYQQTNNIDETCHIYCALGYPGFDNRYDNDDYISNLIRTWIDFANNKEVNNIDAQKLLLNKFEEIDVETYDIAFNKKTNKRICNFFPFTIDNVEKLIEFIQNFDEFDLEIYKVAYNIQLEGDIINKIDSLYDSPYEITPRHSILCNFYVYIFNKVNENYPLSSFIVCTYTKWLTKNLSIISKYLSELSSSEIKSLLFDYALDKFSNVTPVPTYENRIRDIELDLDYAKSYFKSQETKFIHEKSLDREFVHIMFKLYYKTEITNYELTDIWVYFVLNNAFSFSKQEIHEITTILQVTQEGYAENGNILLPWKYVLNSATL